MPVALKETPAPADTSTDAVDDDASPDAQADTTEATEAPEEVLDVTPPENATQAAAETPEIVAPAKWVPTVQQQNLGGEFTGIDMRLFNVQCVKQEGAPTLQKRTVNKKVTETVKVKAADGTESDQEVTKEVPTDVTEVTYAWSETKEPIGDPFPSLTAALRAQKAFAMQLKDEGYSVKEYLSKEYGVWYATEDTGTKPGFRFSVTPVSAPAKPVRATKEPKAPKPPKAAKEPKAVKAPKEKAPKAKDGQTVTAEAAAAASDPVSVEIEE